MAMRISQQLPPGPEAVARARRAIDGLGARLPDPDRRDLRLLASEVVTNALRHAGGGPVELAVELAGDRARLEVLDGGRGFDPPPGGPRSRGDSGWGLVLVDALADRWGVERGRRTRVWIELRLGRGRPRQRRPGGGAQGRGRSRGTLFAPAGTV